MIEFRNGNLLDTTAEAVVNTVNTVGVMGKGIALMFKEAFPDNYREYAAAVKREQVKTGRMFVTERTTFSGPRWIINFPTKEHWRGKSRIEWIRAGLDDLRRVIIQLGIKSIALPPLGCGNGGLTWNQVRPLIERALGDLTDVKIEVFEPTHEYRNVAKRTGVEKLTPARALIAELVRRYSALGLSCSLLEIQKLAWFLQREILSTGLEDPMNLEFQANRYGPYADELRFVLDKLDGSYLRSDIRIADAKRTDTIAFNESKRELVAAYLKSEGAEYRDALERTSQRIDGFESPLGMELLGTIDWLLVREGREATVADIKAGLAAWQGGEDAGKRKLELFTDRMIEVALDRLANRTSKRHLPD